MTQKCGLDLLREQGGEELKHLRCNSASNSAQPNQRVAMSGQHICHHRDRRELGGPVLASTPVKDINLLL